MITLSVVITLLHTFCCSGATVVVIPTFTLRLHLRCYRLYDLPVTVAHSPVYTVVYYARSVTFVGAYVPRISRSHFIRSFVTISVTLLPLRPVTHPHTTRPHTTGVTFVPVTLRVTHLLHRCWATLFVICCCPVVRFVHTSALFTRCDFTFVLTFTHGRLRFYRCSVLLPHSLRLFHRFSLLLADLFTLPIPILRPYDVTVTCLFIPVSLYFVHSPLLIVTLLLPVTGSPFLLHCSFPIVPIVDLIVTDLPFGDFISIDPVVDLLWSPRLCIRVRC